MFNRNPLGRVLLALIVLAFSVAAFGQDLPDRKRNEKPESKKAYQKWIDEDVVDIITPAERAAFDKLTTNEERERFIELIWNRRDPDPDTEENEFREEHYERIAYANEHFTSGKPGRTTDRGRIYIKYGKPDEIESHPMGGHYERPSYEGRGAISTYPFEIWFYRYIPGVGSGIEIEFVDPTGSGEFRIARSPDEKNALSNTPGVSELRDASVYQREQDSQFRRMELGWLLSQPPPLKRSSEDSGIGVTDGPVFSENPLNFDVRLDFFRQSDERVITAISILTENRDLHFADSGGLQHARMNIIGRVFAVSGRRVNIFEDSVETTASPSELVEAKERKSAYQNAVVLAPGRYKVEVIVRDMVTGATGLRRVGFEVPKYDPKLLSTSTLVLASKMETVSNPSAERRQFMIGQTKVIPNLAGNYRRGQSVGVFMQVYNVGTDQTTLRPSVDVQYVLLSKDGKELSKQSEDWQGVAEYGQRLTLARLIDTRNLGIGEYGIEIRIKDRVSGQSLTQKGNFTVTR